MAGKVIPLPSTQTAGLAALGRDTRSTNSPKQGQVTSVWAESECKDPCLLDV